MYKNHLSKYERDYWRRIFSYCTLAERKRLKTLIRRRASLAVAEINGRKPRNNSYWQEITYDISQILNVGSPQFCKY